MPRSNKLIELKETIHPDLHAKVTAFAQANDFELGYAVEQILQTFFSDPQNVAARTKPSRSKKTAQPGKKIAQVAA